MRDIVRGVDLLDDLLCLIRGIVDVELIGYLRAILHMFPIVDVELDYSAE